MSTRSATGTLWLVLLLSVPSSAVAQKISVKSATPSAAAQGTVGLDVVVAGSGFNPGDRVDLFRSGTTDPAGIRVNRTSYVSGSQLVANVDVTETAALSYFDIQVSSSSRSGKGTDLFNVTAKTAACVIPTTDPAHFQLVGTLNAVRADGLPRFNSNLGLTLAVGETSVQLPGGVSRPVLVLFSGTSGPGTVEIFFVDPNTGTLLDGTALGAGAAVQPHVTVALPYTTRAFTPWTPDLAVADLNGDGVPDVVAADNSNQLVAGVLSHVDGGGTISYTASAFPLPSTSAFSFGQAIAIGDLDGVPGDEIVVVQKDQSSKTISSPARVYVYRLAANGTSFVLVSTMTPALVTGDNFGNSIALGDVTGDGRPDVIGGAPFRDSGRATTAGAVLVFPGTGALPPYQLSPTPIVLTRATPLKDDRIGSQVWVGNSNSNATDTPNVLSLTGTQALVTSVAPPIGGVVFRGPVSGATKETAAEGFTALSAAQGNGWGGLNAALVTDVDQDAVNDLVVGADGANVTSSCPMTGTVYVYNGQLDSAGRFAGWKRRQLFQPPDDSSPGDFGSAIASAARWHLLFVGDYQRAVGGVTFAGQIYVYRVF